MKKFEFLDFATADIAFKAYGKTLGEAFGNAALAMFEVMFDTSKIKPIEEKKVELEGEDLKSLLFDFLSELLYIFDVEKLIFSNFEVEVRKEGEKYKLKASCKGEKLREGMEAKTEVKAVTYHHMEIKKEDNLWIVQVVLDV